jgi:hypothetical protein
MTGTDGPPCEGPLRLLAVGLAGYVGKTNLQGVVMTNANAHPIENIVTALIESAGDRPVLTATVDLTPDGTGQPPTLKIISGAVRQEIDRLDAAALQHGDADLLREEGEALQEAAVDASARGALGLVYSVQLDGALRVLELDSPLRTSIHVGTPRVFELARAVYLDRPVVVVTTDLHTMDVVRIQHGSAEDHDNVDWPAHYLSKKGQRTNRDAQGGGTTAGTAGPGHSYASNERRVEEFRNLFASDAAEHLAKFLQPGDLLVVEGVEEARAQLLHHLPADLAASAVQHPAADPTEDARARYARLRSLAEGSQIALGTVQSGEWFAGAYGDQSLGGPADVLAAAEQGRVATVLVHQDAEDHWGDASDTRHHESSVDTAAVEEALVASVRQGAVVRFAEDARLLAERDGIVGIARY